MSLFICSLRAGATELPAPYGTAKEDFHEYPPINVVFDVQTAGENDFSGLYEFVKEAYDILGRRIVVVTYGAELVLFSKQYYEQHQETVDQFSDLAQKGVQFRLGNRAMRAAGYQTEDMHGFVTIVPSGPAEIAYLQANGYSYLRFSSKKGTRETPVQNRRPSNEEPRFKFTY